MALERYPQFGGSHPETAALTNVLASRQIVAPHTGLPFSEAMVFGIGGGLGMGYILWEFGQHRGQRDARVLVVAFQNSWQYSDRYLETTCRRLGLRFHTSTTGSAKVAGRTLDDALARAEPLVAWVDGASMPYLQLPEATKGHFAHIVAVCGRTGADVLVDDLAARPFTVSAETLADARGRIPSFKHRLLAVEGADGVDLAAAIGEGMRACIENLSSGSESFSLAAIRKWARLMTDEEAPKGWPVAFRERRGLYGALCSVFEAIEMHGAPGGLRSLYADFLLEAADVTGNRRLSEPAGQYTALAREWNALADDALPDTVAPFRRSKDIIRDRHRARMAGGDAWRATAPLTDELHAIGSECDRAFPLNDREVSELFQGLQTRLFAIHQAEVAAVESLRRSLLPAG
jgi:hypothetical protein